MTKAKPRLVTPDNETATPVEAEAMSITKPDAARTLERFKVKGGHDGENVGELPQALKVHRLAEAKDYVRISTKPEHWSDPLCFVSVPIIGGEKGGTLHLIDEDLAKVHLEPNEIDRFKLVLATKPNDRRFLGMVPTQNLDNLWNEDTLRGCEEAKTRWVKLVSRRPEGSEGYKIKYARNEKAFPEPKWPPQTIYEIVLVTFGSGRMIDSDDHPALLRLIGDIQTVK